MEKTNQKTISKIVKDHLISKPMIVLVGLILYMTDFTQGKPLYTMVLGLGDELGTVLALGMATLFAILPKKTGQLLTRQGHEKSALVAFTLGIGLLSFIYIGQAEVVRQEANDPLKMLLADPEILDSESESKRHLISTGLIALLYCFATFISYLYYSDIKRGKPLNNWMSISAVRRSIQFLIDPLQKRLARLTAQPAITAESRVKDYIQSLEARERELERNLVKQEGALNYELAVLENARASVEAAIQSAYKH